MPNVGQEVATGSLRSTAVVFDSKSGRYVALFGSVTAGVGFRTRALSFSASAAGVVASSETELADPASPTIDSLERDLVRSDGDSGRLLALLEDTRATGDDTREVMGQFLKLAADGSVEPDGASFSVTQLPGKHEYTPAGAWDAGAKTFFVSWSDDREEQTTPDGRLLYGRTLGADGSLGAEVRIGGTSRWQTGGAVADSGGNGKFLAAWGDYDDVGGIDAGYRARLIGADGQPVGAPIELARYGDQIFEPVSVAWNPCRSAWLVAWGHQQKVFGSIVSLSGEVLENDLVLAEHAEGAGAPRLIYVPAENGFALTFHAWTTENAWLQALDSDAKRVGTLHDINLTMPSLGTFWHPLATRPDRGEVVVLPLLNYASLTATVLEGPGP
jgi:hypothetical protein